MKTLGLGSPRLETVGVAMSAASSLWVPTTIAVALTLAAAAAGAAREPLTLAAALAAARDANASLPVAALEVRIAGEQSLEAEIERRVHLAVEGDFIYAPPGGYDPVVTNAGEERLQLAADKVLYAGGAIKARVRQAAARSGIASAHYRRAVRDVDYRVRVSFAELLAAEAEIAARQESLRRLSSYRSLLESRRRAGQGVASEVLRVTVQLATARSDIIDAEGRRDQAKMSLNFLMGRPPETPLVAAPLPPPAPPSTPRSEGGLEVPEAAAARHQMEAAVGALGEARSEARPHLGLHADAGLWGADTSHVVPPELAAAQPGADLGDRLQRDLGYSVSLNLSWRLTAFGVLDHRIEAARLQLDQAKREREAVQQAVAHNQAEARSAMERASRQFRELSDAIPQGRDAYLEAESRYRGGAGTFLEVLDALQAATDVAARTTAAELAYRQAEAAALRWAEGP